MDRAHLDVGMQLGMSWSSHASQGNPGKAHAAPTKQCHFPDKMSLVLGRIVTWLIDAEQIE